MVHPRTKFICFPSVVCVGKETEVTVFPADTSRRFFDGEEYELSVVGLRDDMLTYFKPIPKDVVGKAEGGCLRFTYTFDHEQEYSIRFCKKGGKEFRAPLYAVKEDLYGLRPLKGELHAHSYYSDGQDGLFMVPSTYREEGFDFLALTDHNRMYPSLLMAELYKDIPLDFTMLHGEEIHTPGSMLHIVHIGGEGSVCNRYIHTPEAYQTEVDALEAELTHVPEQYRRRTAMAKWSCENVHREGGIAIFAHPFWCPDRYNVSEDFCNILFDMKSFDAFELLGGMGVKTNNQQVALWQEQLCKGNCIPVVGSSDSHSHEFDRGSFGRRFTIVFAKENTPDAILDAIRNGMTAAAEVPLRDDTETRFYSLHFRLVAFAQFLNETYFRETRRLCAGEGVLMRRLAEGEPVKELLEQSASAVTTFYQRFFGLVPAPTLSEPVIHLLDAALEAQIQQGPPTCGSSIEFMGTNPRKE